MSALNELHWRTLPLTDTSLIEASAGTGKTYNIALLYLRLVLERQLDVRQVLVTTFTDAAAQELRARIRARLLDAEAALAASDLPESDLKLFLEALCSSEPRQRVLTRVRLALADIDLAPISTIHGFCRRVLSEFPFDTGVPFTLGEIVDEVALVRECVEDFWRRRFLVEHIDRWDGGFVLGVGIDSFAKIVRDILQVSRDAIEIEPTTGLRAWWAEFCLQDHSKFLADLDIEAAFNQANKGFRIGLRKLLAGAEIDDPSGIDWKDLHTRLEPKVVEKAGIKGYSPHISTWPAIKALVDARPLFASVKIRLINEAARECADFVRSELRRRLQARGQTTFTQLIDEVHDRLTGPDSAQLAQRLQQTWPVALIDEFQDTDARQWAIFQRVWRQDGSEDRALILIGDPKQSIYGFRGGDVHSYLAVRQSLPDDRVHSISRNFRSQPNLLTALNGLYQRAGKSGFADSGIEYVEVASGDPTKWSAAPTLQPLRLRILPSPGDTKPQRDRMVLSCCADDVVALLNDRQSGVQPGDVAVLLDTNKRIGELRKELIQRGVPVVGAGRANVMESDWAQELQLVFYALLHPADEYAVRGALATRLLGKTAADLLRLASDTDGWEQQLQWFVDQRLRWDRQGPLAVLEGVIEAQAPRLLAAADGERALTDLRHLGELLQAASAECYGPEELYAWFAAERTEDTAGADASRERQLRIESESARVQLLTIHASKGLQYPVVFVPMAWRDKDTKSFPSGRARYHDGEHQLRLDLGTAALDQHESSVRQEDLQERMRHLYVALTRAERLCVAYTFDQNPPPKGEDGASLRGALNVLLAAALAFPDEQSGSDQERLAKAVPTLALETEIARPANYQTQPGPTVIRTARSPLPSPRPYFGLHSFTSLTRLRPEATTEFSRGAEDEVEISAPDYSEATPPVPPTPHATLIALAKLKGASFGTAIHGLLEIELAPGNLAPVSPQRFATQIERIQEALGRESVRLADENAAAQLTAIADVLDRTLDTELAPGLQLSQLAPSDRCPEFDFAFGLNEARWGRLHELLQEHRLGDWWPNVRTAHTLRGLMQGSLDLVFAWEGRFHVLDYKSNWLGEHLSDYTQERMDVAMQDHHYGLQALIYTVALHRYLGSRIGDYDPERHLGDSWYLFVRAVGLAPDVGVWRKRFPQSLIERLDALFNGEEVSA